jgi:hypothetical protein
MQLSSAQQLQYATASADDEVEDEVGLAMNV